MMDILGSDDGAIARMLFLAHRITTFLFIYFLVLEPFIHFNNLVVTY